jgi:hypothetical protein
VAALNWDSATSHAATHSGGQDQESIMGKGNNSQRKETKKPKKSAKKAKDAKK